jgi:cation transport protein ChaC
MRLTPEHVARVARVIADPGPTPGRIYASDADYAEVSRTLLDGRPPSGEVWVFAYGSLIWKPACDTVEQRVAVAPGWRRAFCLGWDRRFRGTEEQPGLMLALDRGGRCTGLVQRLPPDAVVANLDKLLRREMLVRPSPFPPRWVSVQTAAGPLRAITFAMDRNSDAYVTGLSIEEIADVLAVAAGHWGSMAEYLHNTVMHLQALGIRDGLLWRLQDLVAARIEAAAAVAMVRQLRPARQTPRVAPASSAKAATASRAGLRATAKAA